MYKTYKLLLYFSKALKIIFDNTIKLY